MSKEICDQAAKWARDKLKTYKSSNKAARGEVPFQGGMPAPRSRAFQSFVRQHFVGKLLDARAARKEAFATIDPQKRTPNQQSILKILEQAHDQMALGDVVASEAGNCSAYSLLAQAFILATTAYDAGRVVLEDPGDHVFVIMSMPKELPRSPDKDMTKWSKEIWVCDPWANIVCEAPKYYDAFKTKMDKWAKEGKRILYKGAWEVPNKKEYLDSLEDAKKTVLQWKGDRPTKEWLDLETGWESYPWRT